MSDSPKQILHLLQLCMLAYQSRKYLIENIIINIYKYVYPKLFKKSVCKVRLYIANNYYAYMLAIIVHFSTIYVDLY